MGRGGLGAGPAAASAPGLSSPPCGTEQGKLRRPRARPEPQHRGPRARGDTLAGQDGTGREGRGCACAEGPRGALLPPRTKMAAGGRRRRVLRLLMQFGALLLTRFPFWNCFGALLLFAERADARRWGGAA